MPRKYCCNPYNLSKHSYVSKNVSVSTPSLKEKHPNLGKYICISCKLLISKEQLQSESISFNDIISDSPPDNCSTISSPFHDSDFVEGDIGAEMLLLIKKKVESAESFNDKIHWLTITPVSWSIATLKAQFKIPYNIAKYAKSIQISYGFGSYPPARTYKKLPSSHVEQVINFYLSDDISRIMPGQKDCISVKQNDGKKLKLQKHLILCNLKEAYIQFKSLNSEIKIGFSKFADLRPKQCVLADSNGTHTVCVCKIHQNFKLMFNGLKSIFNEISVNSYEDILRNMICSEPGNNCFLKKCDLCPGFAEISTEIKEALATKSILTIIYQQWINTDRSSLETITEDVETFMSSMIKEADILLVHNFIAKQQNQFLKNLKSNLQEGELIVIGDFSENFSFLIQNAIQSHHWNNRQVTIHPFVIYRSERDDNNNLKYRSFVLISESTEHNTEAVYLFQQKLISWIKNNYKNKINKIYYFSDGAASQYKNKKNFVNLLHHNKDFGIEAEWHFFATSHGKNACDGIGGTVKRFVRRESLRRPDTSPIATPEEFFDFVKNKFSSISFEFCSNEEHKKVSLFLANRFATCKTIAGTRSFHSFIPHQNEMECKSVSTFDKSLSSVFKIL